MCLYLVMDVSSANKLICNNVKNWSWMEFILSEAEGWRVFCFFFGGEKRKIKVSSQNTRVKSSSDYKDENNL